MFRKVTNRFASVWCGMDVIEYDHKFYSFVYPSVSSEKLLEGVQKMSKRLKHPVPEVIVLPFTVEEALEHQLRFPEQTQFSLLFDRLNKESRRWSRNE
jgi:hypothetical protein